MAPVDRIFADAILLVHATFVLFAISGGLLVFRWRRLAILHLPAVAWAAAVELFGWICPLTPLENRLREAAGATPYDSSFVDRYLLPILYPADLAREVQLALGAAVLLVNGALYWLLLRRLRHARP